MRKLKDDKERGRPKLMLYKGINQSYRFNERKVLLKTTRGRAMMIAGFGDRSGVLSRVAMLRRALKVLARIEEGTIAEWLWQETELARDIASERSIRRATSGAASVGGPVAR